MYGGSIRLLPPDRIAGLIPAECGGIRGRTEGPAACVQLYFRASGDCVRRRNRLLRALQPHSIEFTVSALGRPHLASWMFYSALVGLVTLVLAVAGKVRVLFFLWSLAVFVVLLRGFFLTSYSFAGPVHFKAAAYLTLFALIAAIGAWPWTRRREPIRRPMKY